VGIQRLFGRLRGGASASLTISDASKATRVDLAEAPPLELPNSFDAHVVWLVAMRPLVLIFENSANSHFTGHGRDDCGRTWDVCVRYLID